MGTYGLGSLQPISQRPYPSGLWDREFIDAQFDLLHRQGRLEWAKGPTSFTAPIFVVWRTVKGEPKDRLIVDLRALNKITIPDSYLLPRQEDIIQALRGARYITAIDALSFFFQFGVNLSIVTALQ